MRNFYFVLVAIFAGAAGGSLSTYAVLAHNRSRPESLIRAHRFELLNDTGQPTSFWGTDSSGYEILAFGTRNAAKNINTGENEQQLAIGLAGKSGRPFVAFYGSDRQIRVLLDVDDYQRPLLQMSDGAGLGLTLGSARTDTPAIRDKTERWALNFLPEDTTRIGISTVQDGSQTYVRASSFINAKRVRFTH